MYVDIDVDDVSVYVGFSEKFEDTHAVLDCFGTNFQRGSGSKTQTSQDLDINNHSTALSPKTERQTGLKISPPLSQI